MNSTGPDPRDPLLSALAEYWDDIQRLADDQQRQILAEIVAGTADPDPVNARAAAADLLLDVLPPDHPMVEMLRGGGMLDAGGDAATLTADLERSWSSLRRLLEEPAGPAVVAASAGPLSEFDRQVQSRLLSLPGVGRDELRRRQVDPDNRGLIRLPDPVRGDWLPAFQFTAVGLPWPVVERINEQFGAAADPWGVTCWWTDPHAGLGRAPADLLGRGQDDLLLQAAAQVGED